MAWVMVAVVTAPVDMPSVAAISHSVVTALVLLILAIIEGSRVVEAHQIVDGFDAGSHRHCAGRGVGDLGVGGVGLAAAR